jgi:hypothetical protein
MKKLFLLPLFLLALAGCVQADMPVEEDVDELGAEQTEDDDRFIDGDMTDIADRNPNFLELNEDEGNTNNIGEYRDKVWEVVEGTEQFQAVSVINNGNNLYVNLSAASSYTDEDIERITAQLQRAVPRYDIHVRVLNNPRP